MKIRNGFVSNSSSSSFVIVCTKEAHDKALKNIHPYYQKWVNEVLSPEKRKFADKDVVVSYIFICSDEEEPMDWDGDYPPEAEKAEMYGDYDDDEDEDEKSEKMMVLAETCLDMYVDELKKTDKNTIYIDISC